MDCSSEQRHELFMIEFSWSLQREMQTCASNKELLKSYDVRWPFFCSGDIWEDDWALSITVIAAWLWLINLEVFNLLSKAPHNKLVLLLDEPP